MFIAEREEVKPLIKYNSTKCHFTENKAFAFSIGVLQYHTMPFEGVKIVYKIVYMGFCSIFRVHHQNSSNLDIARALSSSTIAI